MSSESASDSLQGTSSKEVPVSGIAYEESQTSGPGANSEDSAVHSLSKAVEKLEVDKEESQGTREDQADPSTLEVRKNDADENAASLPGVKEAESALKTEEQAEPHRLSAGTGEKEKEEAGQPLIELGEADIDDGKGTTNAAVSSPQTAIGDAETAVPTVADTEKQLADLPAQSSSSIQPDKEVPPPPVPGKEEEEEGQEGKKGADEQYAQRDHQEVLPSQGSSEGTVPNTASTVQSNRQALADPDSVAVVAHAFGRDSPALSIRKSEDQQEKASNKALPSFPTSEINVSEAGGASATPAGIADQRVSSDLRTKALTPDIPENNGVMERAASSGSSSNQGTKIGKGAPPPGQATEEAPFDFNRFLEQMKHRSAQPVAEYVRSFIKGFAKKPYRTQDQIKLIFDFLDFISARMRKCEIWESVGEAEFENAKEAMEKLVMNRLYPYTFTPAVEKEGRWAVQSDDLERDRVLKQRINLFGWLKEEHLDVPVGDHSRGFIEFSIQELLKINHYKAPRDKLICILNCCKVIFGMIRHLSTQENADTFIPVLIFVVLKANPENLISNVEYISRFRNPDRLSSESGYYLSSLMGAISFIETMDYTSLSNISQEEFEHNVEQAVSTLPDSEAQQQRLTNPLHPQQQSQGAFTTTGGTATPPRTLTPSQGLPVHQRTVSATSMTSPAGPGEEAAKALPFTPIAASLADDTRAFFQRTGEAARTGLSRPMGALGRLINEGIEGIRTPSGSQTASGASTERQNSPAPPPNQGGTGMAASTSRSRLFAGLFGSAETPEGATQARAPSSGAQTQTDARGSLGFDGEPQTPSSREFQQGYAPYKSNHPERAPDALPRLVRPNFQPRGDSNVDAVFDEETAGRRDLIDARAASGRGDREKAEHRSDGDEDYDHHSGRYNDTPNAAAVERMRRRQMRGTFGSDNTMSPSTPSRQAGLESGHLQAGRREAIEYENAATEEAIHESLVEQQQMDAVQAQEEAQNSASVETLKSIFPTMDDGVIQMVLQGCEGNVEIAIDRLLEMQ